MTIKYGKKITKLKLRKSKYLYTWKTAEVESAKKLIRAIPKSIISLVDPYSNTLNSFGKDWDLDQTKNEEEMI